MMSQQKQKTANNKYGSLQELVEMSKTSTDSIPKQDEDKCQGKNNDELKFKREAAKLQRLLKTYFFSIVKYKSHTRECSINCFALIIMLIEIAKLVCITIEMFRFGHERENFNFLVTRGQLTIKNLILKGWGASWETPSYPPAHGDFAVYDIRTLKEKINYAVERLYNIEEGSTGYYKCLHPVKVEFTYFDFDDARNNFTLEELSVKTLQFKVHVQSHTNHTTNETMYTYDVDADLQRNNLTEVVKNFLTCRLIFRLTSMRIYVESSKALCLVIDGNITFQDPRKNGQTIIDLESLTKKHNCNSLGYNVQDMYLAPVSDRIIKLVFWLSILSCGLKSICLFSGFFLCKKTLSFIKMHPERFGTVMGNEPRDTSGNRETADQHVAWREYVRILKIWDLLVLVADGTAIAGNQMLSNQGKTNWTVRDLDEVAVLLGLGCLFAWVSLLKYFKIHHKFHMLFSTIYATFFDVLAYLSCICVLFVGYMLFGFLVLGPYNVKFQTTSSSLNTLFSIINGDEIYATFALLEENKIGSPSVPITHKIYLGSFIAIFTIVVLNLFIALFTNAYDAVKGMVSTGACLSFIIVPGTFASWRRHVAGKWHTPKVGGLVSTSTKEQNRQHSRPQDGASSLRDTSVKSK